MKRVLLIAILAATISGSVSAHPIVGKILPKFTIGIKAGVNLQQFTGNYSNSDFSTGIVGGLFAGVTKKKIGVQVEGLARSADITYTPPISSAPTSIKINTVCLDIPLLFQYKLFWRVWAQAGPQFSTFISAKQNSTDVKNNLNTTNFSGVLGLQANLPLRLSLSARYILGLTNVNNESKSGIKDAWNDRSIQLSLGFRFL
jgi:dipeptide/tripeptide permease